MSNHAPSFVIFALPRSRTAWLSHFLTYGEWSCGHDELRHMRSIDDARSWFSQPFTGTVETAGAPFWRLLGKIAPDTRIVVIRRPVKEVIHSLMSVPGVTFDRDALTRSMTVLDRKLDQIEARLPCLSVRYSDLAGEEACASIFEHCLPYRHDPVRWQAMAATNIQIDMRAMVKYITAHRPQLEKLATVARHQMIADLAVRRPVSPAGVTFQIEDFDTWLRDARPLIEDHLVRVGEAPNDWQRKNLPLMRTLSEQGCMQLTTARSNGRMFGYLMTLIAPSLTSENVTTGTNLTFYASEDVPGLGMKLQREALRSLRARGVDEVFFEAGNRGSGPRIGAIYKRLGAVDHGRTYRLDLKVAA